jgi:Fur family ferric uptake transcriptional regulator
LNLLSRASGHLSAKDIYAALYPEYPGLGLTTIYRTLELLHRLGIVQKVTSGDGQGRYELRSDNPKDHHHHLICTRCGAIINYRDFVREELELVKKTEEALTKKYDFAIQDHNIEFLGLCAKCR